MKLLSPLRLFLTVLTAVSLAGCLQVERIVHLKPDGSGTIEEKLTMSAATVAQTKQMQALGSGGGDAGEKPKPFKLLDETKLKAQAAEMGEGVTFVSAKPISGADGEGYVATYAFADISKLNLAQGPSDFGGPGGGMKFDTKSGNKPLTFEFAKGRPAKLTIKLPDEKLAEKKGAKPSEPNPADVMQDAMLPMVAQMMKDMRMKVAIEVEGKITDTNAEYREGQRVTLMDVDFNALIAKPDTLKALIKQENQSPAASKALLKGIDGVKVEGNNPVTISFQ